MDKLNNNIEDSDPFYKLFDACGEEEITAKIPLSTFAKINDATIDLPFATNRIILFQAKPEYQQYYTTAIYGAVVRSETNTHWLGTPIKNPTVGLIKWDKTVWNKIYGFSLNISILQDP